MSKILLVLFTVLVTCFSMCVSGCSSVHVGGSGKIGDVHGSGGISIPVPK